MAQARHVFELSRRGPDGYALWAYRYRLGGRESNRVQRGGFSSKGEARAALDRALERARREQRRPTRQVTLAELVDEYVAQHEVEPGTTEELRWLRCAAGGRGAARRAACPHRGQRPARGAVVKRRAQPVHGLASR